MRRREPFTESLLTSDIAWRMYSAMQIGTRMISADTAAWFQRTAASGETSRHGLARGLCEREDWRNARGALCVASAKRALPKLARELHVALPAKRACRLVSNARPEIARSESAVTLSCSLRELGEVRLEPVGAAEVGRWRAMMERWHPQGCPKAPGAVLNYWIVSARHGRLGGLGFRAASWHVKARDRHIGWSNEAKRHHLNRLLNHYRFLLMPGVAVPHLASHVLGLARRQIGDDWEQQHGVRPQMAYTYVNETRPGTCYRAANWSCVGWTAAQDRAGVAKAPCRIFMVPLQRGWKRRMRTVPRRPIGTRVDAHVKDPGPNGDSEFAYVDHHDGRLGDRIRRIGDIWGRQAAATIPEMFPESAERQAVYRLLSNREVTMKHVLGSHVEATVKRCRAHRRILAVQDTTMLNYSGRSAVTTGLAPLGGGGQGSTGLAAHMMLAFVPGGRPLGVLSADADFRRAGKKETESRRWEDGVRVSAELAAACKDTEVICVGDREMDIWAVHRLAAQTEVRVVVRACRSKQRRVVTADGSPQDLFSFIDTQPELGRKTLVLDAAGGPRRRPSRTVKLLLRAARVTVLPPGDARTDAPLEMLAVQVREVTPADPAKPLNWVILSSTGEATLETALEVIEIYEDRWAIERYFDTLKNGTRICDRRLDDAEDLRKCLAFDAVAAWRIHELSRLAREAPDTPATEIVRPVEVAALNRILTAYRMPTLSEADHRGRRSPNTGRGAREASAAARAPPTVRDYVLGMGRIVGFESSKRQPLPGPLKCFRGDEKIQLIVHVIENTELTMIE